MDSPRLLWQPRSDLDRDDALNLGTGTLDEHFPTLVYWVDYPAAGRENPGIHDRIRERLASENPTPPGWHDHVRTSFAHDREVHFLDEPCCSELKAFVCGHVERFAAAQGLPPGQRLSKSWFNVFPAEQGYMSTHDHAASFVSGVYYVQAPEGCGDLYVPSPHRVDLATRPAVAAPRRLNAPFVRYAPVAGRLLLFRGWVEHGVRRNESREDRVSISFNTVSTG